MAVQIVRQDLIDKVQEGWKKKALADHYGLPVMQMTKILKDLGLTIRKFHEPKYVLVDAIAEEATEAVVANIVVDSMEELEPAIVNTPTPEAIVREEVIEERPQVVRAGW